MSDETDAKIRELHKQGLSFALIAAELGMTRDAVAGRVRDLRLSVQAKPLPANEPRLDGSVALFDLQPHHCRWPIGDAAPYVFCGDTQQDGSSYCGRHRGVSKRVANQP